MKVMYFMNTYFAGIGGEDTADDKLFFTDELKGPAAGLKAMLGDSVEMMIAISGDNYSVVHKDEMLDAIEAKIKAEKIDALVAGPAFNAGRYAQACGNVCERAMSVCGIPAITSMHEQCPGLEEYRKVCYVFPSKINAAGMKAALSLIAPFIKKIEKGEKLGPAAEDGYFPRGIRKWEFRDKPAAERMCDMLEAKVAGKPFITELPVKAIDAIEPAAPIDVTKSKIAIVTTGCIVPYGNPDHLRSFGGDTWGRYNIAGKDALKGGDYEAVHGGYTAAYADKNPNYVVPVSMLREMEKEGKIGELCDEFISTAGVGGAVIVCEQTGKAMAEVLKAKGVQGVVLTSTWGTCTRCGATIQKQIELAGIPTAIITAMFTLANNVGATRVVEGGNISHPCGNPALPEARDKAYMRQICEAALELIGKKIDGKEIIRVER